VVCGCVCLLLLLFGKMVFPLIIRVPSWLSATFSAFFYSYEEKHTSKVITKNMY
jgi:hypothetical protein